LIDEFTKDLSPGRQELTQKKSVDWIDTKDNKRVNEESVAGTTTNDNKPKNRSKVQECSDSMSASVSSNTSFDSRRSAGNCWRTTQNMHASPQNSTERHLEEHLSQQHRRLQKDP